MLVLYSCWCSGLMADTCNYGSEIKETSSFVSVAYTTSHLCCICENLLYSVRQLTADVLDIQKHPIEEWFRDAAKRRPLINYLNRCDVTLQHIIKGIFFVLFIVLGLTRREGNMRLLKLFFFMLRCCVASGKNTATDKEQHCNILVSFKFDAHYLHCVFFQLQNGLTQPDRMEIRTVAIYLRWILHIISNKENKKNCMNETPGLTVTVADCSTTCE